MRILLPDWGTLTYREPQRSIVGRLLFITYINDPPLRKNSLAETIIFAYTSVIISHKRF